MNKYFSEKKAASIMAKVTRNARKENANMNFNPCMENNYLIVFSLHRIFRFYHSIGIMASDNTFSAKKTGVYNDFENGDCIQIITPEYETVKQHIADNRFFGSKLPFPVYDMNGNYCASFDPEYIKDSMETFPGASWSISTKRGVNSPLMVYDMENGDSVILPVHADKEPIRKIHFDFFITCVRVSDGTGKGKEYDCTYKIDGDIISVSVKDRVFCFDHSNEFYYDAARKQAVIYYNLHGLEIPERRENISEGKDQESMKKEYSISPAGTVVVFENGERTGVYTPEMPEYKTVLAAANAERLENGKEQYKPAGNAEQIETPENHSETEQADQIEQEPAETIQAKQTETEQEQEPAETTTTTERGKVPEKTFIGTRITGKGYQIFFDPDANRTRVIFDHIPGNAEKETVKAAGFWYSANLKSWNKKLTFRAYRAALKLHETLETLAG